MDKLNYLDLIEAVDTFMTLPGESWNQVYRARLAMSGLMLTTAYPLEMPWVTQAPECVPHEELGWPSPSYVVPVQSAPPVAPIEQELRDALRLFRDFYNFYVTQTKMGASHHHPIWTRVAAALGKDNNRKVSEEEYHFLTAPFWESEKRHEKRDEAHVPR